MTLEADTYYYILAIQREGGGGDHLNIAISMPITNNADRDDFQPHIAKIYIDKKHIKEEFEITLMNATSGTFDLSFTETDASGNTITYNKLIKDVPFDASSGTMRNKIRGETNWSISVLKKFLNV